MKRNKQGIRNSKLASAMLANNDKQFWKAVKSINDNTKQCVSTIENRSGADFTKGLRLRLSQGLKSEPFVFAKSWAGIHKKSQTQSQTQT